MQVNYPITSTKGLIAWGAVFALGWGGVAGYFLIDLVADNALALRGTETTGEVIKVQRVHKRRGSDRYRPIIEFRGADGMLHTFEGENVQKYQAGDIGDKVPVVYLPDNPGVAIINNTRTRFNSLFGLLFTLPGLLIGLLVFRFNLLKWLAERKRGR